MPVTQTCTVDASFAAEPLQALLVDVSAAMPQPVLVVSDVPPYALIWRNAAAGALSLPAAGLAATTTLQGFAALQDVLRGVVEQQSSATIHDHLFAGMACARMTLTALPTHAACLIVLTPQASVIDDDKNKAQQAVRSAGLLARMLAHEIKNPLAGIKAAGQLLQKSAVDHAAADLAGLVVTEALRITKLVDRMSVFDTDADSEMTRSFVPLNLHAPLEQALAGVMAAYPDLQIQRQFDPSLPDIAGAHDQLVQIFDNLLRNAAEAGATNITLRSFYRHSDAPIDARHQQRLPVTLEVSDNGAGMDAQTRQRLFEPYYTTKSSGQGLGLAIVARLVDAHGGVIDVSSDNNNATVFRLSFAHRRDNNQQEKI